MTPNQQTYTNAAGTVCVDWLSPDHARLELNRPAQHNALGLDELEGLSSAATYLKQANPKVLTVLAKGSNFGVGGDIHAFAQAISDRQIEDWLRQAIGYYNNAILQLRSLEAAVVVGVQGACAGGSLGLIWCADHVIFTQDASISMAYAKLGGSPDGGTSWLLPRLVNPLRAFELFTLKSTLKAQQALDWGLVNQVVSNESLHDCVNTVAKQWMNLPGQSLKNIKQLIRSAPNQNLGTHLLQELEGFVLASQQPDFAERVMQFSQSN